MQPTQIEDSTTLLTYSLTTTPMPVQVSPSATTPSLASLTFVVSCPRGIGTATVAQIEIAVPVDGTGRPPVPTNLAATPPLLSKASISSSDSHQWNPAAGSIPGVFIFTPKGGPVQISSQSLTIEITGIQVNALVGTALVRLGEWAAPKTGAPPPVTNPPSGTASFAVAKFPYGFFAGNFTADQPMIENGQQPTLSWQGSANATYKILYEGNTVDVTSIQTWSPDTPRPPKSIGPSPVLTHTTTFILQVSAQVEGQTATVDFSITIEVDEPSLTAKDLRVCTTSNLQGAVTIGSTSTPADLAVNGNVQAGGNAGIGNSLTAKSLIAGGGSFLFSGGSRDGSSNVVLRTDSNYAYLFPWGTGTRVNSVAIGGAIPTNFNVSGTTVLNGSVGIGTYSPATKLNVDPQGPGGILIGNSNSSSGGYTSLQLLISAESGGYSSLQSIQSAGSAWGNLILNPSGGNVGIGTTTPGAPLHVATSNPAHSGYVVTGIYAQVSGGDDWGLYTNGQAGSGGGNSMFTHLPTKRGHRVVTSPLCLEAEVHVSGTQKLSKGKARVRFERDVADILIHSSKETYRILLTPIGQCNGLTVTEKSKNGFVVAELAGGKSNAGFDWFIIAHKPARLGAKGRQKMPAKLPQAKSAPKPPAQKKKR
jgi:hypothetical protein